MAVKKKTEKQTSSWIGEVEKYSRQIWLAGLGAYSKVSKDGTKLFDTLVKDGEKAEKQAKSEVDKQVGAVKAGEDHEDFEGAGGEAVGGGPGAVVGGFGRPVVGAGEFHGGFEFGVGGADPGGCANNQDVCHKMPKNFSFRYSGVAMS